MMFRGGQKGTGNSNKFRWNWHGDLSLTAGLLKDVPPEIELSEYGRIPSPGSESPSALLNGESLNLESIADLDLFVERLYNYYCEKGLWCIITKWIVELLSLGFTICFSGFFLLYVDWNGLRNAKCGMDAVGSGIKPCDLAKEALHQHPLSPLTVNKAIIVGYLGIFSIYWIFCFLRFFVQLKHILNIRHFYYHSLNVTDSAIQTMPWEILLDKVVKLQTSQKLCVVKDLSAHDILMRLMRKENYFIGMINKAVLAFQIPSWLPGVGPAVNCSDGRQRRPILTKTLEWTLNWCILQSMFDRNFCVRKEFISNPRALKKRLMLVGLTMLVLSPFLVIFMLVYLFLRHAEQFYNHPYTASSRRWSNLSRWMFREFNEVDHLFRHRINSSVLHASDFLRQFPSPIISLIAKFISFVSGGFAAAILLIIAFLEESLLEGHIFGRNLLWYAAVFGSITAISRATVTNEPLVLDPEGTMSLVVQYTHYMPKRWRGNENSESVRIEFETMFQYTGMILLEEMTSIFLTPYLLMFVVPKRVDDILQFISDFTVHVEGVGHVCSFSVFDFRNHGNSNYGSPHTSSCSQRSSQGKMEKSFLSFHSSYPSWEPDPLGKQFLSNLRDFRDRMMQGHRPRISYSPPRAWPGAYVNWNSPYSREILHQDTLRTGTHLGSLWFIDEQRNHPYLIDWYYKTYRPQKGRTTNHPTEDHKVGVITQQHQIEDLWTPPYFGQNNGAIFESIGREESTRDRMQSHLGASTSAAAFLFRESMFQDREFRDMGHIPSRSHWWARTGSNSVQNQTSFIEPPEFGIQQTSNHCYESRSDRSIEEWDHAGEEPLDWRISQRRTLLPFVEEDDIEAGEVSLHLDDVYSK
ncbi:hypothetical protein SAY87_000855 [Trapa incisa]|uniref:Autophagy-related protein 9 n=1 Tax=Trapa incisa TaxID=236973 RepID=A0AAN7JGI0_9MYRT|nr:hypothetical protein SAY87_000855 [Trapa incisa]